MISYIKSKFSYNILSSASFDNSVSPGGSCLVLEAHTGTNQSSVASDIHNINWSSRFLPLADRGFHHSFLGCIHDWLSHRYILLSRVNHYMCTVNMDVILTAASDLIAASDSIIVADITGYVRRMNTIRQAIFNLSDHT